MGRRLFNPLGGYSAFLDQKPAFENRQTHTGQLSETHDVNMQVAQVNKRTVVQRG